MPKLRAFVHVSTAYVNGNQPKGTTVPEHMLGLGGVAGDHLALVNQLQALPKAQAASQVSCDTHKVPTRIIVSRTVILVWTPAIVLDLELCS